MTYSSYEKANPNDTAQSPQTLGERIDETEQFPIIAAAMQLDRDIDDFHLPTKELFALGQQLRENLIVPREDEESDTDIYHDLRGNIIAEADTPMSKLLRTALRKTNPDMWVLSYDDYKAKKLLKTHIVRGALTDEDRIELKPYIDALGKEDDSEADVLARCSRLLGREINLSAALRRQKTMIKMPETNTTAVEAGKSKGADRASNDTPEKQSSNTPAVKKDQPKKPTSTKKDEFNGNFYRVDLVKDSQGARHIYVFDEQGNRRKQPVGADYLLTLEGKKARPSEAKQPKQSPVAPKSAEAVLEIPASPMKPANPYLTLAGGRVALGRHVSRGSSEVNGRYKPEANTAVSTKKAQFAGKQAVNSRN